MMPNDCNYYAPTTFGAYRGSPSAQRRGIGKEYQVLRQVSARVNVSLYSQEETPAFCTTKLGRIKMLSNTINMLSLILGRDSTTFIQDIYIDGGEARIGRTKRAREGEKDQCTSWFLGRRFQIVNS